jgi:D-alanyl-D-alanine carboxypeptidase (penicillin-binding protein 5/6)
MSDAGHVIGSRIIYHAVPWLGSLSLWLASAVPATAEMADPFTYQAAAYMLMVDGRALWFRQATRPLLPASLTKVMTALLVLERAKPEEAVQVTPAAAAETGTRLGLRAGETMRVADLLAATLLLSANDSCHALAEHVGGTEARFVALMNERARSLGLRRTHFTNPCGHDQKGHRSTAENLAVLAQAALHHPAFAALVATVRTTVTTAQGRSFELENKNELVGRYPGAVGVKTGFTSGAGKCLIALAERQGRQVLLVLLNAPDRWWTAVAMLDYAFSKAVMRDR